MSEPVLTAAPLGAFPEPSGMCTFRVWAPRARSVAVRTNRGQLSLEEAADGMFHGRGTAEAGDHDEFILDGREPRPVALAELVGYELHVGTFSQAGTFDAVIPHLAQLRELGVTAIQLMPVATFAGTHGWGYGDLSPIERWGHDAQWEDSLHHATHVLLTGEHEGYYSGYGAVQDVARELVRAEGRRFVVCAQNHDQVGNRAVGDRLRGRDLRLAAFCAILSGGTPMLFAGEEYDEAHPFQYFTDHVDREIARLTRDGRRDEFAEFSDFSAEETPDPQDPETFRRSKLDPDHGDEEHMTYYRELLALRRTLPDGPATDVQVDEARRVLRFTRGPVRLAANFSDVEQDGVPARTGVVLR